MRSPIGRQAVLPAFLWAASLPVLSHHSLPTNYLVEDDARTLLTGSLVSLDWRNPHVILGLQVAEADGTVETFRIESYPASYFEYRGFQRDDLSQGSTIAVEIYPGRSKGARSGWARVIHFPDGTVLMPVTGDESSSASPD